MFDVETESQDELKDFCCTCADDLDHLNVEHWTCQPFDLSFSLSPADPVGVSEASLRLNEVLLKLTVA